MPTLCSHAVPTLVIPAQAGIQIGLALWPRKTLDSGLRRNDDKAGASATHPVASIGTRGKTALDIHATLSLLYYDTQYRGAP
jgi:hypothetical protein